jgi:hypothetical protein
MQIVKEFGMVSNDLDSQALSPPATDVERFELAALDTLQHRLARHSEAQPRVEHREIAWRRLFDEARPQLVGHANAPGGARGRLFADNDPGREPAMQGRRRHAEDVGRLLDGQQVAVGVFGGWLAPGNVAVAAHVSGRPIVSHRGRAT